jgi:hypothetical protein
MIYLPYWYRLTRADAYLIWYTDTAGEGSKSDGVLLDDAGRLPTFQSLAELQAYASGRDLSVDAEMNTEPLDLDTVAHWLGAARKTTVDCPTFLAAWNLFSDLASAVQGRPAHIDDQTEDRIYDKLFWGSNLPAMTPPGKHYTPTWTKSEVGRLRSVLNNGMQLFQGRLSEQPTEPARGA